MFLGGTTRFVILFRLSLIVNEYFQQAAHIVEKAGGILHNY